MTRYQKAILLMLEAEKLLRHSGHPALGVQLEQLLMRFPVASFKAEHAAAVRAALSTVETSA